jgi:uncharacterized protein YecE (DUF72 family)
MSELVQMAQFFVGTSGWNYYGWRGSFYPENLPSRQWLSYYAEHFNTTEVNYSFYHLPRLTTYENWHSQTPEGFIFALKASRLITHIKRLKSVRAEWTAFVRRAAALSEKLGPILLQLPPSFHATPQNLKLVEKFLEYSASRHPLRLAMEFRHESCFSKEVVAVLSDHKVGLVLSHSSRYPVPGVIATAPFVYFRFHGPKALFASSYSESELEQWGAHMKAFLEKGRDVYAYFNNDVGGYAVANAATLMRIVG